MGKVKKAEFAVWFTLDELREVYKVLTDGDYLPSELDAFYFNSAVEKVEQLYQNLFQRGRKG